MLYCVAFTPEAKMKISQFWGCLGRVQRIRKVITNILQLESLTLIVVIKKKELPNLLVRSRLLARIPSAQSDP